MLQKVGRIATVWASDSLPLAQSLLRLQCCLLLRCLYFLNLNQLAQVIKGMKSIICH